ncbi:hypothetical protein B6A27_03380, partial [Anoxybacillus sp. UARK-01]|uniref:4'-phosphopantetheinyl transferase family protein n=1 Tax=Anoxybacillus sp. UARK-01 TaxID=1895648 RepID=UPI0009F0348F
VNPLQVSLIKNKYGKLFINKLYEKEVYFNLSHTDNMILCGITKIGRIGVDIEKNDKNFLEIMNLVFTPEEIRYVNSFNNRLCKINAFYKIWTRKEAYMKMIGKGFSLDPLSFSVPAILDEDEDRRVLFYTHNFSNEYVFSIAVKNNKGYGNIKYIVNNLNLENFY